VYSVTVVRNAGGLCHTWYQSGRPSHSGFILDTRNLSHLNIMYCASHRPSGYDMIIVPAVDFLGERSKCLNTEMLATLALGHSESLPNEAGSAFQSDIHIHRSRNIPFEIMHHFTAIPTVVMCLLTDYTFCCKQHRCVPILLTTQPSKKQVQYRGSSQRTKKTEACFLRNRECSGISYFAELSPSSEEFTAYHEKPSFELGYDMARKCFLLGHSL
jgi:hypothetical protein